MAHMSSYSHTLPATPLAYLASSLQSGPTVLCICLQTHEHTCMHAQVRPNARMHMHAPTHPRTHARMHPSRTPARTNTCKYACTHTRTYACMHTREHAPPPSPHAPVSPD